MNIREILNFICSIDKVKLDRENNQELQNRTEEKIYLNDMVNIYHTDFLFV